VRRHIAVGGFLLVITSAANCAGGGPRELPVVRPLVDSGPPADSLEVPVRTPRPIPRLVRPDTPLPAIRRDVTVCAGGDVMLGSNLDSLWAARASARLGVRVPHLPDPIALAYGLRPLVADADIVLVNVEGALGEGPTPRKCREGAQYCYTFRQPPEAAQALRRLAPHGTVVGNVANNHAMDAGAGGFRETVIRLDESGVLPTGADTLATLAVAPSGDTVAFLGFSTFQAGPDARDLAAVARHVGRARELYGRVIVTMHMGAEGAGAQRTPRETEMFLGENRGNSPAFARTAVAAGAAAVIGHGPHVMRAAEWLGDAFVAYSLGNLLTYGPFNMAEPRNRGGFLCLGLDPGGRVTRAEFRSTRQEVPGLVRRDPRGRAALLVDSLSRLDFPETGATLTGRGLFARSHR
jgi:hypothetical protein